MKREIRESIQCKCGLYYILIVALKSFLFLRSKPDEMILLLQMSLLVIFHLEKQRKKKRQM